MEDRKSQRMECLMHLEEARAALDLIDAQIADLFCQRLDVVEEIAGIKAAGRLPVHQPGREEAVLRSLTANREASRQEALRALYERIFEISRARQRRLMDDEPPGSP